MKKKILSKTIKKRNRPIVYSSKRYSPSDAVQISKLVAIIHSVKGCRSKKTKKLLLYSGMKKAKYLVKYFRMTYDPNFNFGFTWNHIEANRKRPEYVFDRIKKMDEFPSINENSGPDLKAARWNAFVKCYPVEFQSTLDGIISGDLGIGLSVNGVNKVLERLKVDLIPIQKKSNEPLLRLKIRGRNQDRRKNKSSGHKSKRKTSKIRNKSSKKNLH